MNIYEKLTDIQVELQNSVIKKTGHNKFAGFKYFELGDFLPTVNDLFKQYKLNQYISFTQDFATLTITNSEESSEQIIITSPMVEIEMKGANQIQNLGAVQTYQRRYLYLAALGIVENDIVDSKPLDSEIWKISDDQFKELTNRLKLYSMEEQEKIKKWLNVKKLLDLNLSKTNYDKLIAFLDKKDKELLNQVPKQDKLNE